MKTLRYFFIVGLALVCMQANSQSMGVKAGLNISSVGGDSEGIESRFGYHAGVFYDMKINDVLGFQPEVVFSSQGAQAEENSDLKIIYNYVNVPLMLKYYVNENLNIQGGPQFGVLTSAKAKLDDDDEDLKDMLETFDMGVGLGLGYEINKLQFTARYNLGLTNTVSDSGDEKFPNRVIQVGVGFVF